MVDTYAITTNTTCDVYSIQLGLPSPAIASPPQFHSISFIINGAVGGGGGGERRRKLKIELEEHLSTLILKLD